jgi:hypothetical protein
MASSLHQNSSSTSCWCLSEAKKLFHPKGNELSALDAVSNQIDLLQACSSPHGYFDAMDCGARTKERLVKRCVMVQQKV